MEDLSREEQLEQEILNTADEYGNKKWLRVKRTFFVISGAIYLIELCCTLTSGIEDISIDIVCGFIFAPLVAAGFIMFLSLEVLSYIITGAMKDEKNLAKKMGELNAIKFSQYNDCKDKKIEKLENHIEYLENYQEKLIEENTHLRLNKVLNSEVEKNEED